MIQVVKYLELRCSLAISCVPCALVYWMITEGSDAHLHTQEGRQEITHHLFVFSLLSRHGILWAKRLEKRCRELINL